MNRVISGALSLALVLPLSACATSAAGLARQSVGYTVRSTKSAQSVATCAAEVMQGTQQLRGSGNHWWVLRTNLYGVPIVRWDFTDQPSGGSIAELRANSILGAAKDKVTACS